VYGVQRFRGIPVVGKKVSGLRDSLRLTQEELAPRLRLSKGGLSNLERSAVKGMNKESFRLLAEVANLSFDDLEARIGWKDDGRPAAPLTLPLSPAAARRFQAIERLTGERDPSALLMLVIDHAYTSLTREFGKPTDVALQEPDPLSEVSAMLQGMEDRNNPPQAPAAEVTDTLALLRNSIENPRTDLVPPEEPARTPSAAAKTNRNHPRNPSGTTGTAGLREAAGKLPPSPHLGFDEEGNPKKPKRRKKGDRDGKGPQK
jgi:transcriptional regulator with XRE-family HTH domain